jgi:hypothetical protein
MVSMSVGTYLMTGAEAGGYGSASARSRVRMERRTSVRRGTKLVSHNS